MPKFMIIDADGNITRAINLPYEGMLIDISDIDDAEFNTWHRELHKHKVEMDDKGKHKKDARGLPVIIKRTV